MCAYAGNILGCALMVAIFANTGLLPQLTRGAEALAIYKTAAPFKEVRPSRAVGPAGPCWERVLAAPALDGPGWLGVR